MIHRDGQNDGDVPPPSITPAATASLAAFGPPTLQDYVIGEKAGQGAQGTVYRATHVRSGDVVALKQIDVSCLTEKERVSVLAEVKVLATLAEQPHPCIMSYRESFVADGSLWIALEWSAGGTLQDAFSAVQKKKRPEFTEDEVWNMFLCLCLALDHIHNVHHVLHRDVKLANIFLHESGTRSLPRVQLGDFGVSTILDDRSRALTMVGTPYYLSPELCMGKPYSMKSDIWSLGVALFVLLNQKMPFEASNYAALILRIVQQEHAKHHDSSSRYSTTLRKMATWCMQKDEKSRPTARDILLHPDCMRHMMRLELPMSSELLEEACFRAPVPTPLQQKPGGVTEVVSSAKLVGSKSIGAQRVAGSGVAAAKSSHAAGPSERPLPVRRAAAGALPQEARRRVRVVQGVSNAVSTPVAVAPASRQGVRPGPSTGVAGPGPVNIMQVMRGAQPTNGPAASSGSARTPVTSSRAAVPLPPRKKDVSSVAQLPSYGMDDSDDDDVSASKHQPPLPSSKQPLYSYEKRLMREDPSRAQRLLSASSSSPSAAVAIGGGGGGGASAYVETGGPLASSSSPKAAGSRPTTKSGADGDVRTSSYLEHMRSWHDEHRPGTRGSLMSGDTIALLRKHDLAPDDVVVAAAATFDTTGNQTAIVVVGNQNTAAAAGSSPPPPLSRWGAAGSATETLTGRFAQHANITNFHGSTLLPTDTTVSESHSTIPEELQQTSASLRMKQQQETMYANDTFEDDEYPLPSAEEAEGAVGCGVVPEECGDGERDANELEDDDEDVIAYDVPEDDDDVDQQPPASVYWRVDEEYGSSSANRNTSGRLQHAALQPPPPLSTQQVEDALAVVPDDAKTELLLHTHDVSSRAHELCIAGEQLIGEAKFAEIVELLTREVPVSSDEVQRFIRSRVSQPEQVPELMYLCFRYVLLEGELRRLRREHLQPQK